MPMREAWTGVGTALITPFTQEWRAWTRRRCKRLARAADRSGRALPGAVRHDRRDADALGRREAARRGAGRRGGARAGAGAGRRRRLRHEGSRARREARCRRRALRAAVGDAVLQQADAGRALPALLGGRRRDAAADRPLQRARPHRLQHRPGDRRAPGHDSARRGRQGSVGEHPADGGDPAAPCRATSWCCPATTR